MTDDRIQYIIIQAGGRGSRMGSLTRLKPKAMIPVDKLPMIFHFFRLFEEKKFIIIGDYKYDALEKYLSAFADVDYTMVRSTGKKGTCAGLRDALAYIPEGASFVLTWCDIVLPEDFNMPRTENNVIGISKDFPCRWKYENNEFTEESSTEYGVAGFFVFKDKSCIDDVPDEGEFVRWLKSKNMIFETQPLYNAREYGIKSEWDKFEASRCRPFNSIKKDGGQIVKIPLDDQGRKLAKREANWYKKLQNTGFTNMPHIYGFDPLRMDIINGKCIYEYDDISYTKKREILKNIVSCLRSLHSMESVPADRDSYYEAYIGKTFERLEKIKKLVPFAEDEYITINNTKCPNVFFMREELEKEIMRFYPDRFHLIHGDCTFSNTMLQDDSVPVFIDPRGYFGSTELYGDTAYDWAKLYYSLYSNYDQFNLKRFELQINKNDIELSIESNGWEELDDYYFDFVGDEVSRRQIKMILAIIWLSLTTYAWEDYDSICGAFYNGLYYLRDSFD